MMSASPSPQSFSVSPGDAPLSPAASIAGVHGLISAQPLPPAHSRSAVGLLTGATGSRPAPSDVSSSAPFGLSSLSAAAASLLSFSAAHGPPTPSAASAPSPAVESDVDSELLPQNVMRDHPPHLTQGDLTLQRPVATYSINGLPWFLRYPRAVLEFQFNHPDCPLIVPPFDSHGLPLPSPSMLDAYRNTEPLTLGNPTQTWLTHDYALFDSTPELAVLASELCALVAAGNLSAPNDSLLDSKHQHVIAGGTIQTTWPPPAGVLNPAAQAVAQKVQAAIRRVIQQRVAQLHNATSAGRRALADRLVPQAGPLPSASAAASHFTSNGLEFAGSKVLVTRPGFGAQPLHHDSDHYEPGDVAISAIFYCSPTSSTFMPRYPAGTAIRPPPRVSGQSVVDLSTEAGRAAAAFRALLLPCQFDRSLYHSVAVQPGQLLLFRHSVLHAGTSNSSLAAPTDPSGHRILFFDTFGQYGGAIPTSDQYYQWHYVRDTFGPLSREYCEAVHLADTEFGYDNGASLREDPDVAKALELRVSSALSSQASCLSSSYATALC